MTGGIALAALLASVVNLLVSLAFRALGASGDLAALQPAAYISFTVLGVIGGAAGWVLVRAKSRNPAALLRILVPLVVVASFVPDILLLAVKSPGADLLGISGLMVMHVVVAAIAVPAYGYVLPLRSRPYRTADVSRADGRRGQR
ncbi:DUF6069 family protein [Amycolatopsis sp. NPDC102389]|uniref:DUF6069 family protein n=1 Tax=Amycolatopsis sp. NPDC102389 TaxID=3363941 RepID=UPI0037F40290